MVKQILILNLCLVIFVGCGDDAVEGGGDTDSTVGDSSMENSDSDNVGDSEVVDSDLSGKDSESKNDSDKKNDSDVVLDSDSKGEGELTFTEDNGYLVMEMENTTLNSGWAEDSQITGGSGTYLRYLGNNICNGPANDPLEYLFSVETKGVWEMRLFMSRIWHCVEGTRHDDTNHVCMEGDGYSRGCENLGEPVGETCGQADGEDLCLRKDLSNDVFVRIQTLDGTLVEYLNYAGDASEVKLFGGGQNEFAWSGQNALDPGGAKKAAQWELDAGQYELIIYGRSQGASIDRILMFHETADFNTGKTTTQTL